MLTFFKKLFLFFLPASLVFIFPATVFVLGREYYSANEVFRTQSQYPGILVGFAYNGDVFGFKKALIKEKKPKIFALGSSRTGMFREEFFTAPSSFVTASNAVGNIGEMNEFIAELSNDNEAKVVILGLDPAMFLPAFQVENISKKETLLTSFQQIYRDYLSEKKFTMKELFERSRDVKNIGLRSILKNEGFREDGSFQYSSTDDPGREKALETSFDENILSLQKNRNPSEYLEPISEEVLSSLGDLLAFCEKKHIYIVGFVPPSPSRIYQELVGRDDNLKKRVLQLPKRVGKIFSDYHFAFYDFSDISIFGGKDSEFFDTLHGTDKLYLRMTIYMAERNKTLGEYVDIEKNKELLKTTKGDFLDNG